MASTEQAAALTEQHRQAQLQVRARALKAFMVLWPLWTGDESSFGRLVAATMPLVRVHHQMSVVAAVAYYQAFRKAEQITGAATPRLAGPVDVTQIVKSMYVTGQVMTKDALAAGRTPAEARRTALTRVSGAVTRHVLAGGRDTILQSVTADKQAVGWARVTDGDPCYFCLTLASRGAVYKTEQTASFEAHDHCVPAGTLVTGPSVERGFRRWYEGEMIVVGLAGGDELSITPNHPVLTDRGWVEAGLLREGDNVVHRFGADLDALRVPHEDDAPTPIEDVWGAPRMDRLRAVPVAAEDFHGDGIGTQGDVDVVAPHGLLAGVLDPALLEIGDEELDAWTGSSAVADTLSSERDLALMLFGVARSASRCVGCGSLRASGLRLHPGNVESGGASRAPALYASGGEPTGDHAARYPVSLRDGLLRFAGEVQVDDSGRHLDPAASGLLGTRTRFDPPTTESEADSLIASSDLGRRLLERLAGGVELRRVVKLRRSEWAGHVYNLQTAEGWYDANGIIVSNCGCTAEPFFKGAPLPPLTQKWRDIYNQAQREAEASGALQHGENSSNARLNAVRSFMASR